MQDVQMDAQMKGKDDSGLGFFLGLAVFSLVLTLIAIAGVLGWQVLWLLKDGEWTHLSVLILLSAEVPTVEWRGLQKALELVLNWPLALQVFSLGSVGVIFGSYLGTRSSRAARHGRG